MKIRNLDPSEVQAFRASDLGISLFRNTKTNEISYYDEDNNLVSLETLTVIPAAKFLVYTALLTQTSTNAPVATILENTLGGTVVWTYGSTGNYVATLIGAFTAAKTVIFGLTNNINSASDDTLGTAAGRTDADALFLNTYDITTDGAADVIKTDADDLLTAVPIEIRVYL